MARLTKRTVEAAEVRVGEYMLWDGDLPGFGVRVSPSGRRSYLVQYRVGCRSRRITLGPHGVLTADRARGMAIEALAEVRAGGDPAGKRKERREALTCRSWPLGSMPSTLRCT
ncbi:Arm DNA-binding domain-containing protein [uncultured Sphingomonas sp.]|uniref:Arm DNA-binding domain-containing protein n=1 Tax=uncultured Sphingomonas sp. TaxID=158754 RepID=UPI0034587DF1